jgi:cytoskeletal protein CcmA (bactofilin family)
MGNTYTRQSSYSDGDVITAAHTNDEFNQLLAAFQASSGHTHDGTANEGGPITKMLGTSLTLGDGTAGTDITVTFDGETSDGVLKWMEDEDYFEFSDDILVASTEKIQFRDTAIYLNSSTDGQLDIVADTEVQIAATTIDINGNADISGNLGIGGNLTVTGTTTFNGGTMTLGDAATDNVVFGADVNSAIIPNTDNTYDLGSSSQQWKDIYINGTAYLDAIDFNGTAISATAAELNIIDGDTSATSTTLADADRVVVNDAGTMKQVALTDFETYFESALDTLSNVTTVGALNSGSITSGFGTIDTGSSTITTTGLITGGSLDIDDVVINGSTIGHTDDTDLITVANGVVTVAGEISVTTLDIGGTNVTSTATELNLLDGVSGLVQADFTKLAAVDATAAELNIMDGDTSATSTTLADADRVVVNDAGTMKQVALTDFETYFESALDTLSNVTTVGALNSGSITSGFGTIDTGSSTITTTGLITGGSLDIDDVLINGTTIGHTDDTDLITLSNGVVTVAGELDATTLDISGNADIDGTLEADAITVNGTALNTVIAGVTVANATTAAVATTVTISDNESTNEDNAIVFTSGGDVDGGNIGLESDGDLTYNPSTGRLTATQLSGTLQTAAQANVTSLGTLTTLTVDNVIINGSTIGHTGDTDLMTVASGVLTVAGEVDATSLDISGDADIDGTLEADAITVNGTALNTVIANEATALAIALG